MFSTLSSYIWASEQEDQTVPDNEIETKEQLAENEWVLVDVVINSLASEKSGDTVGSKQANGCQPVNRFAAVSEESWYITPPSCFNASQTESSTLETSPLENLLIEHPSMSVYGSPEPLLTDEETEVAEQTPENLNSQDNFGRAVEPISRTHRQVSQVVDKVELLTRRVQKNVVEQAKRTLRKKNIERTNKTQQHTSHSRRKRKQYDRQQGKHSGVYSHRGC